MADERTEPVLLAWSGGKDCAMVLDHLRRVGGHDVVALLTTVTEEYRRISMHGVREALLEQQAASVGLALHKVRIPADSSMEQYEAAMRRTLRHYQDRGVASVAFGDIFLEDVRQYREDKLAQVGMAAVFPLWGRDTAELAWGFIERGFKAVVTCIDSHVLERPLLGRVFDAGFLGELPAGVDPCGENGEFHSFVYDGPIFDRPVPHRLGEVVLRENRYYFCDLIPAR